MNRVLPPKVIFKETILDEKRIELAFSRIFEIARRNIISKKSLTTSMSEKYIKVQHEQTIFNNRRGGQNA